VLRIGQTDWRSLAVQMPKATVNAADAPMTVDLSTNLQTWGPDSQFSDVNYAPTNEISRQFRFFAEYWLNAYGLQSGSTEVIAGQGPIGTFAFSKLSSTNASFNLVATSGMWSGEGPNEYTCKNEPTRNATGRNGDYDRYCIFDKESDAQTYCSSDSRCKGYISNQAQDMFTVTANPVSNPPANGAFHAISRPEEGSTSYVGTFADQSMFWNSEEPSTGGTAAGLKTAAALASTSESAKFNYNYSAFEKPVWKINNNFDAMGGQIPPQLAGMSIPSWQFMGLQDSAEACQNAATDDPDHVYDLAVYHNASFSNGNSVYSRACYGHVAGAPDTTLSNYPLNDVQTMTPPHGLTKMGGKDGIAILKKMYQLNNQIMALTDKLKIAGASANAQPMKESFTQRSDSDDATIAALSQQFKTDEAKLNAAIQSYGQLEMDEKNAKQLLLQSRIKFGVALVIGLALAYFAFRFLTADELPSTIKTEIGMNGANSGSGSGSNLDMDSTY
jgi:hypothetical protein